MANLCTIKKLLSELANQLKLRFDSGQVDICINLDKKSIDVVFDVREELDYGK